MNQREVALFCSCSLKVVVVSSLGDEFEQGCFPLASVASERLWLSNLPSSFVTYQTRKNQIVMRTNALLLHNQTWARTPFKCLCWLLPKVGALSWVDL